MSISLRQRYLALLVLRQQRTAEINARLASIRRVIRRHGGSVPRLPGKARYCDWCERKSATTRPVRFTRRTHIRPRNSRADIHTKVTRTTKLLCLKCYPHKVKS